MKVKILNMLRNADGYVSGQSICNELGVSRTAVWKYINMLKEEGYMIEAAPNKGYFIAKYPDVLTEAELASIMVNRFLGSSLHYYEEIDSTNNEAKRLAENGAPHGTLVIAEKQISGRGRRGRNWISPAGSGIWMTFVLRPEIEPYNASMLTLVAALATAVAVRNCISCEDDSDAMQSAEIKKDNSDVLCAIKWPNDIVMNGKKVCGILTEMSAEPDLVNYVVVGIGINTGETEFAPEIEGTATSILAETGINVKRSSLVADICLEFEKYYDIFMRDQDLSGLIDEYNSLLINAGREVVVSGAGPEIRGTAIGIDKKGELLVKCEDGSTSKVMSGEVSVRGLYGYV